MRLNYSPRQANSAMRRCIYALVFASCLLLRIRSADACVDTLTSSETMLASRWTCSNNSFAQVAARNWRMIGSDGWVGAGWNDCCNNALPTKKMLNAFFVVINGPVGHPPGYPNTPMHDGRADYYSISAGSVGSPWHNNFYWRRQEFIPADADQTSWFNSEYGRFLAEDRTSAYCNAFQLTSPLQRAAVVVHEGVHHWGHKNSQSTHHMRGCDLGPAWCCPTSGDCDIFYHHWHHRFPYGELWTKNQDVYPTLSHQAYQLQFEFACDVAVTKNPTINLATLNEASVVALGVARTRIYRSPPYVCFPLAPLWSLP